MTEGELIRQARKKAHITQEELGVKLGVSGSMIAQYETGKRKPKYETLERIAAALGVESVELKPVGKVLLMAKEHHIKAYIEDDVPLPPFLSGNPTQADLRRERLLAFYDYMLNEDGKREAVKRVQELTEIKRYQPPPAPPESPQEGE